MENFKSYKSVVAISAIGIILVSFILSLFNVELPLEYITTLCSIVLSALIVFGTIEDAPEDINSSDIKNDIQSIVDTFKEKIDLSSEDGTDGNVDNEDIKNDKN